MAHKTSIAIMLPVRKPPASLLTKSTMWVLANSYRETKTNGERPKFQPLLNARKRLSRTKTAVFCPRCRKNHILAAIWAWLVDEVPESPDDSTSTKSAA